MRFVRVVLTGLLITLAANAQAAGLKFLEIPADSGGPAIKAAMWSPCAQPAESVQLGPFALPAVRDCPIAGDSLPLVILSHGFKGTYFGHHDTAETLADAGFVVVALNHPGDTTANTDPAQNLNALVDRPTDVKRVIDFMLDVSPDARRIDPNRIGFFGFSRGGYTGLVLAGANPDLGVLRKRCPPAKPLCDAPRLQTPPTPLAHDPRIRAFVIADPLAEVFTGKESLKAVAAPIQLWSSEDGGDGVWPQDIAAVADNLPAKPDFRLVANAGHFAFLAQCPAELLKVLPPELCTDKTGFDRAAFHTELNREALAFLRQHLVEAAQP